MGGGGGERIFGGELSSLVREVAPVPPPPR